MTTMNTNWLLVLAFAGLWLLCMCLRISRRLIRDSRDMQDYFDPLKYLRMICKNFLYWTFLPVRWLTMVETLRPRRLHLFAEYVIGGQHFELVGKDAKDDKGQVAGWEWWLISMGITVASGRCANIPEARAEMLGHATTAARRWAYTPGTMAVLALAAISQRPLEASLVVSGLLAVLGMLSLLMRMTGGVDEPPDEWGENDEELAV